jgi:type I restriction enzyme S subunit
MRGASYPAVTDADVLSLYIPFPPYLIQRRIVARIETLLAELKEARALAAAIRRDTDQLLAAAVHEVFTLLRPISNIVPLAKVATAFNGRASGEGNSTVRVFKTKHVYPRRLRLDRPSYMRAEQVRQLPKDRYLKPGDVLMANIAEGTLGRVTYVHECEESWTVDTQVMILRSLDDRNLLLGKWLYYYLWSERGQQEILARRSGIAFADKRGQTHIYPKNVLEIPIPAPPIEEQIQAVARLDSVQAETDEMRRLQTQDAELLNQLEQSILERAFRGEL